MIIKSASRKQSSFGQLFGYMVQQKKEVTKNLSFIILHNVSGQRIPDWVKAFEANESLRVHRRSNSVVIYHECMSFHKQDTPFLTKDILMDLAEEYIQLRAPNALCIATSHTDQSHVHIHFGISGVEHLTGLATRISRQEFQDVKEQIQSYQQAKFPELSHSIVRHGKDIEQEITDAEFQLKKRTGLPSKRDTIKSLVADLYSKSSSRLDFYSKIQEHGLSVYERAGRMYGVEGDVRVRFSSLGIDEEKLSDLDLMDSFETLRGSSESLANDIERADELSLPESDDVLDLSR